MTAITVAMNTNKCHGHPTHQAGVPVKTKDATAKRHSMGGERKFAAQLVDLRSLSFNAKIDFITIDTPRKMTLPALAGKAVWPRAYNGRRLTVHDATPSDMVALVSVFGPARLLELEVAVDLRPTRDVPPEECDALLKSVIVDLFARGLEPSAGVGMKREFRAFYRKLDSGYLVRPFNKGLPRATDQQLHGGRDDDAQVKVYLKRSDQGISLSSEKQVARVEVRLGARGLFAHDLITLCDLKGFRFRKCLMPYFRHVKGTSRPVRARNGGSVGMLNLLAKKQHEIDQGHWPQAGVGAFLRGGKREGGSVRLIRNTDVNSRFGQALMRLERQFCKTEFVRSDSATSGESPTLVRHYGASGQSSMTTH